MEITINGGIAHRPSGWKTKITTSEWKGIRRYVNYAEYDANGRQRNFGKMGYIEIASGAFVGAKSDEKFLRENGVL